MFFSDVVDCNSNKGWPFLKSINDLIDKHDSDSLLTQDALGALDLSSKSAFLYVSYWGGSLLSNCLVKYCCCFFKIISLTIYCNKKIKTK